MKRYTIIWDFDGTILPSDPYDSEQTLLRFRLNAPGQKISLARRVVAEAAIYADRKEWLGVLFKKFYLWILKGTPIEALDRVTAMLAQKITSADRKALKRLSQKGYAMMVISCGTLDLIERTLNRAGLDSCMEIVPGNQFKTVQNRITGMAFRILRAEQKLEIVQSLGISAEKAIAVGDGYTDLPLLDWVSIPIMMDRTGKKKRKYAGKGYFFISSTADIEEVIAERETSRSLE